MEEERMTRSGRNLSAKGTKRKRVEDEEGQLNKYKMWDKDEIAKQIDQLRRRLPSMNLTGQERYLLGTILPACAWQLRLLIPFQQRHRGLEIGRLTDVLAKLRKLLIFF